MYKLWLISRWHQQKYKKWAVFDILMTITWGVNMIIRQMTPFFPSTLWALSVGIFISAFQDLQNSVPQGPSPLCIMFWSVKFTHLHAKDDTFEPVNIGIFFLQKICKLLLYDMLCLQFDTNFAPIPWTKHCEESFWAFSALHLLCNISTKFSTFCLFVF